MDDPAPETSRLDAMFRRQEARLSLAQDFWDLAGGRPGFRVADVGCGPGAFTLRFAGMAGPTGHVHAVDADADALAFLTARLDPAHHAHVTTERLDITRAPLPALGFDVVFATDVLHHVLDLDAALRNLRQTPARLVVAEFDPSGPGALGPPREMRLAPTELVAALERTGWKPTRTVALAHEHYALVCAPGPRRTAT